MKSLNRPLAVIDFETDPFLHGREPAPFCVEFLSDTQQAAFWGDDCAEKLIEFLENLSEPHLIYAHNGGKFDFHFLLSAIDNPVSIINGRIVECQLFQHTMRDSFAILPAPLRDYKKDKTDYATFERHCREDFKKAILEYLHSDCVHLLELVWKFIDQFGPKLTIGSTAIKELIKLHPFERLSERSDAYFRQYYYGGRVQAFEAGIVDGIAPGMPGNWHVFDVNGMYPDRMANVAHPMGDDFEFTDKLPSTEEKPSEARFNNYGWSKPFFARIIATQRGPIKPFPMRDAEGGLDWNADTGEFFVTSHELEVALAYGLVEIHKIVEVAIAQTSGTFAEFVSHWNDRKIAAEKAGDVAGRLFAKLILNSAYGKTGQDPHNYSDFMLWRDYGNEGKIIPKGYRWSAEFPAFEIWARPSAIHHKSFYNVAIAASITGASRAKLLEGLLSATRPIYCDTDSIICADFAGEIDPLKLGAWKLEASAQHAAIAGKKLYALWNDKNLLVKLASKGGKLSLGDLQKIARGGSVDYKPAAPTYSLKQSPRFQSRHFTMTAETPSGDAPE